MNCISNRDYDRKDIPKDRKELLHLILRGGKKTKTADKGSEKKELKV